MKMKALKVKIIGLLFVMFTLNVLVIAQDNKQFSLTESLNYALENSFLKKKELLQQSVTEQERKIMKSKFLPQVNAYAKYLQYLEVPTYIFPASEGGILSGGASSGPYPIKIGEEFNFFTGLSVKQVLFDRSWLTAPDFIEKNEKMRTLKMDLVEEEIIYETASNFYRIRLRKEQVKTLDSSLQLLENLEKVMQLQFENDLINQTEVDRIKIQIMNLRGEKTKLESAIEQRLMLMKFLMGMPFEDNLELVFEEEEINVAEEMPDFEVFTQSQLMLTQKELLSLQKEHIKSKYFLTVNAFADFQFQAQRDNFSFFDAGEDWYGRHLIGIGLNFPIFSGMAQAADLEKSQMELSLLDLNFEQNKMKLMMEYRQSLNKLENSRININQQKSNRELAERVYNITLLQYKEGITPLYELFNVENMFREANTSYQTSLLDMKMAKLQMLRATDDLRKLLNN